jgi:hypothetical protein
VVARSTERGFSPDAVPRITVAGDGTLAAIVEPTRIVVV